MLALLWRNCLKAFSSPGFCFADSHAACTLSSPIVMPSASMILATPLNPHTMLQRSIVLPDDAEVTLRITGIRRGEVLLSFDGTVYEGLACGDEIQVRKDEKKVRLLKLEKNSFLEVLRNKLE